MKTESLGSRIGGSGPGDAPSVRISPGEALARLASACGVAPGGAVLDFGTLRLHLYAPRGIDPQEPHDQNELYFVARGSGIFRCGGHETPFAAGDALFVPAETQHSFLDFSDDFEVWAVLWGPPGGETAPLERPKGATVHDLQAAKPRRKT